MKYGFIGCGNMGGALAAALRKNTNEIILTSKSVDSAIHLSGLLQCEWSAGTQDICEQCDVIILAVKPQSMYNVLLPLRPVLQTRKPILVSMAAGITINAIENMAGGPLPIIRIMPNTPTAIGKGMITYCHNDIVEEDHVAAVLTDFIAAGRFDAIDESLMDAASAVAGSSPAYAYMFIEAMADGAVACGLPRAKAMEYAAAAVSGAAELLLQSERHPGELKDAVCSPGGSTIAGVKSLEEHCFRGAVINAIIAAYQRNRELGE